MYDTIEMSTNERGVCTLILNRPGKHNALSGQMIADLTDAAKQLGDDDTVRVVVLAANGPSFCAGGDLNWMKDQVAADSVQRAAEANKIAAMFQALNSLPKPLVGRIHGDAFGGGVGMACVCDMTVAIETAKFGLTETRLGLIPATIGPYVVARLGEGAARRIFISSRRFSAQEALGLGLVGKVVDAGDLDGAIENEISPYLDCAPGAVAAAKGLALRLGANISQADIDVSVSALVRQWESDEAAEGIEAFFERRKAKWCL